MVQEFKNAVNTEKQQLNELISGPADQQNKYNTDLLNRVNYSQNAAWNSRRKLYLPVYDRKHAERTAAQLKQYQSYSKTFDSRTMGPALLRCRMQPQTMFECLSSEIFDEILDEVLLEFVDMLKEVVPE